MSRKQFYVYVHRYASGPKEGEVFYVGKGSGKRAYTNRRFCNPHWMNIYNKYGFNAEIVAKFAKEKCSFSFEVALIKHYGRKNLCNMTDGGEGISGSDCKKGSKHHNFDHAKYTFSHETHGKVYCTRYDLYTKFNLSRANLQKLMLGSHNTCGGWWLGDGPKPKFNYENHAEKISLGRRKTRHKLKKHKFRNDKGESVFMSVPDFAEMIGSHKNGVYDAMNGKSKHVRGWKFVKPKQPKSNAQVAAETHHPDTH